MFFNIRLVCFEYDCYCNMFSSTYRFLFFIFCIIKCYLVLLKCIECVSFTLIRRTMFNPHTYNRRYQALKLICRIKETMITNKNTDAALPVILLPATSLPVCRHKLCSFVQDVMRVDCMQCFPITRRMRSLSGKDNTRVQTLGYWMIIGKPSLEYFLTDNSQISAFGVRVIDESRPNNYEH